MTAFFAYRLPGEKNPIFFKGEISKIENLQTLNEHAVVFSTFEADALFCFTPETEISKENITTFEYTKTEKNCWTKEEYFTAFDLVKTALASGDFTKLVLSRIKAVSCEKNPVQLFEELNQLYPATFNYLLSSADTGVWLGATPELLLSKTADVINTVALAGTKPNDGFSEWTKKEREEQQMVTDYITEIFRKNHLNKIDVSSPFTIKAGPVEHLKTEIEATIQPDQNVWQLLSELHPTPATCGLPKGKALRKIREIENRPRSFYTGYVLIKSKNDFVSYVNLRCMQLEKNRAYLHVGGGITASSKPENEWMETERKAMTLEKVCGGKLS